MILKFDAPLDQCELKFDPNIGEFHGYASVFGSVDAFGDTIVKGAFEDSITDRATPIPLLYGHDQSRPPKAVQVVLFKDVKEGSRMAEIAPFTENLEMMDGKTTIYVCRNFICEKPVNTLAELKGLLD